MIRHPRRGKAQGELSMISNGAVLIQEGKVQSDRTAQDHGLRIKLHADQLSLSSGTRLGIELGAISVDHLEQIEQEDIDALSHSNCIATLLPVRFFIWD